jgi:ABC-type uncharacterized transport system auxiliary subunit
MCRCTRCGPRPTGANRPQPVLTTENGAAAAALQRALDAILAEIKKWKI